MTAWLFARENYRLFPRYSPCLTPIASVSTPNTKRPTLTITTVLVLIGLIAVPPTRIANRMMKAVAVVVALNSMGIRMSRRPLDDSISPRSLLPARPISQWYSRFSQENPDESGVICSSISSATSSYSTRYLPYGQRHDEPLSSSFICLDNELVVWARD